MHAVQENQIQGLVPVFEIARTGTLMSDDVGAIAREVLEIL